MENLNEFIKSLGVSLFGYADLRSFEPRVRESLPFGISAGIALDPNVIKRIPSGPYMDYVDAYSTVTARLDEISRQISKYIIESGYSAIALDREFVSKQTELLSLDNNDEYKKAPMPHKTVAACAGLGWITKSALIVTKEYGSAVRFTSVLTDAPLETAQNSYECLCKDCTVCKNSCPTGAIRGNTWTRNTSREELMDYELCQKSLSDRGSILGVNTGGTCGICIAVCPFTKQYLK